MVSSPELLWLSYLKPVLSNHVGANSQLSLIKKAILLILSLYRPGLFTLESYHELPKINLLLSDRVIAC